jgi:hypothetical protein
MFTSYKTTIIQSVTTMKKTILILLVILATGLTGQAQRFVTKNGMIRFYSEAPLEKIEATNHAVNAALDASTGDLVFKVLIKSFVFPKALMQEHFNENYMESDKFQDAKFIGKVTNIKEVNVGKDGIYNAMTEGKLTIHGVTKEIKTPGTFEVKEGKVTGKSKFNILLSDYDIKIPSTVVNNISKSIEITVEIVMDKINL